MKFYKITVPDYMLSQMQMMSRMDASNDDSLRQWFRDRQTRTLAPDMVEECCKDRNYMMMIFCMRAASMMSYMLRTAKDQDDEWKWYKEMYGGKNGRDSHIKHQADR